MKLKSSGTIALVAGGCHFAASMLIVPITLRVGEVAAAGAVISLVLDLLHGLTRVLYFPILGLALYPRLWFPGGWIFIPILLNSLLWGLLLAGVLRLAAAWRTRR